MLGCQAGSIESRARTADQEVTEFPGIGLRFTVPDGFMVGRFAQDSMPPEAVEAGIESPWKNAVVLAEPDQLSGFSIDAIAGRDSRGSGGPPCVDDVRPRQSDRGGLDLRDLGRNGVSVPGLSGPIRGSGILLRGEAEDEDYAEVAAHRFLFRTTDMEPSHYDEAILSILGSLEVID